MGAIYKATCRTTGKSYIGYTTKDLEWRKQRHKNHSKKSKTHFHNAIRKYGWEDFEWSIIESNINEKNIKQKEINYIKKYNTYNMGYNSTEGGEGTRYFLGKKFTEEHKKKISESLKGHEISDQTRLKISQTKTGIPGSPRDNHGSKNPMYGRKHTDETKQKMREAALRRYNK
jgi:group I intron endonuclease